MEKVDVAINSVKPVAKKTSSIAVNPSIGLDLLTQRCVEKQRLMKDLGQTLLSLKALVSCPQLMNSLRRRLKQQEKKDGDEYRIQCIHEPSFDWGIAYRAIDLAENTGTRDHPLSIAKLRYCS